MSTFKQKLGPINPELTQRFIQEIKTQKSELVEVDGVTIRTCKDVFPPRSDFSRSSEHLHQIFGDLKGAEVLDMGTGTGIQAIQAAKAGARHVTGLDINPAAVICAQENVGTNQLSDRIVIRHSDLFSALGDNEKFDLIIANLPITDFPIEGIVESAVYDPGYRLHQKFLADAKAHLKSGGGIVMTHIDFKGDGDFEEFERMVTSYGYNISDFIEIEDIGYHWRMYRIVAK